MVNLWDNPDLLVRTGSHLYGCNVPASDVDTRGFALPPAEYLLGRKHWEQYESKEPDTVIWSFQKFFNLLERFSPNTVEIIFAPKKHIIEITPIGERIIDNKHLFVSKRLIKPIQGFAFSEWKKAIIYDETRKLGKQRIDHTNKYGYSVKNAYHAIRLLGECIELMETGNLTFPRPDADFLRKVRHGEVPIEVVEAKYNELDAKVLSTYGGSNLPDDVNKDSLDNLYYGIIEDKLKEFFNDRILSATA